MASSVCSQVVAALPLDTKPRASTPTLEAFLQTSAQRMMGYVEANADLDILITPGGGTQGANGGNQRYQKLIEQSRPAYWMARSSKRLVESIRIQMVEEGRRFLRLNPENDRYFELSRSTVKKRIAQDLRDSLGDLTEKAKNKRPLTIQYTDDLSLSLEPLPLACRSRSLDGAEERSSKRPKYEALPEAGSVAANSALTEDSPWCFSKESEEGPISIEPVPFYPMMFPYHISTGASNHGWRSHGSSSTLATLPKERDQLPAPTVADMMRQFPVEIEYLASGALLEPIKLKDGATNKSAASSIKSKSVGSDSRLAKETQSRMNLETFIHHMNKKKTSVKGKTAVRTRIPSEADLQSLAGDTVASVASTLATLPRDQLAPNPAIDLEYSNMMRQPLVEIDFGALEPLEGAAASKKPIVTPLRSKSMSPIRSRSQLKKKKNYPRREPMHPPIPCEVDLLPLEETIGNLDDEEEGTAEHSALEHPSKEVLERKDDKEEASAKVSDTEGQTGVEDAARVEAPVQDKDLVDKKELEQPREEGSTRDGVNEEIETSTDVPQAPLEAPDEEGRELAAVSLPDITAIQDKQVLVEKKEMEEGVERNDDEVPEDTHELSYGQALSVDALQVNEHIEDSLDLVEKKDQVEELERPQAKKSKPDQASKDKEENDGVPKATFEASGVEGQEGTTAALPVDKPIQDNQDSVEKEQPPAESPTADPARQ